jgi:hypothetical protein
MENFDERVIADALRPGAPLVIQEGPLQGVPGTLLGFVQRGILVAVLLANGLTALELEPAWVRFDTAGAPLPLPTH